MAANSKHYGDVLAWLRKVIDSCITKEQVDNSRKLLIQFERLYNPQLNPDELNNGICDLYRIAAFKRDDIITEELNRRLLELN